MIDGDGVKGLSSRVLDAIDVFSGLDPEFDSNQSISWQRPAQLE